MILTLDQALEATLKNMVLQPVEQVDLELLVNRVIAEDIVAPWDMPRWDNSEMDGYAVQAEDCCPGTELDIIGYIPAGQSASGVDVLKGTAVRIMTGAPIPAGCDAVVPVEQTTGQGSKVCINGDVTKGDYIRFRGSDIEQSEILIEAGSLLRPADVNLLASFGHLQGRVYSRPKVAILSTGDELVAPGESPGDGQIIDSNSWSLAAAVREIGAEPILLGIARDEEESLREKITEGLKADVLITSAGVSAGDRDLVRYVLEQQGVKQHFWKIRMKPAGPTAFGCTESCAVFSLPGNPVSSMIGFQQLVRPALMKVMGRKKIFNASVTATLTETLTNETEKLRFLRVRVTRSESGLLAKSAGNQNTGVLKTMLRANAIAVLPAECSALEAGSEVDVQLLNPEQFFSEG